MSTIRRIDVDSVTPVEIRANSRCGHVLIYSDDGNDFDVFSKLGDDSSRARISQLDIQRLTNPNTSYGFFKSVSGVGPLVVMEI